MFDNKSFLLKRNFCDVQQKYYNLRRLFISLFYCVITVFASCQRFRNKTRYRYCERGWRHPLLWKQNEIWWPSVYFSNDISEEHILTSLNEHSISILSKTDANEISPFPKRKMNCNEKPSSYPSASLSPCPDCTSVCDAENSEHDDLIGLDEKKYSSWNWKRKNTFWRWM